MHCKFYVPDQNMITTLNEKMTAAEFFTFVYSSQHCPVDVEEPMGSALLMSAVKQSTTEEGKDDDSLTIVDIFNHSDSLLSLSSNRLTQASHLKHIYKVLRTCNLTHPNELLPQDIYMYATLPSYEEYAIKNDLSTRQFSLNSNAVKASPPVPPVFSAADISVPGVSVPQLPLPTPISPPGSSSFCATSIFNQMAHIRKALHQGATITKECGVYCGLCGLLVSIESIFHTDKHHLFGALATDALETSDKVDIAKIQGLAVEINHSVFSGHEAMVEDLTDQKLTVMASMLDYLIALLLSLVDNIDTCILSKVLQQLNRPQDEEQQKRSTNKATGPPVPESVGTGIWPYLCAFKYDKVEDSLEAELQAEFLHKMIRTPSEAMKSFCALFQVLVNCRTSREMAGSLPKITIRYFARGLTIIETFNGTPLLQLPLGQLNFHDFIRCMSLVCSVILFYIPLDSLLPCFENGTSPGPKVCTPIYLYIHPYTPLYTPIHPYTPLYTHLSCSCSCSCLTVSSTPCPPHSLYFPAYVQSTWRLDRTVWS